MSNSCPPDLARLHIDDDMGVPMEGEDEGTAESLKKLQVYARSLPYSIEPESKMQSLLDFYLTRFVQVSAMLLY